MPIVLQFAHNIKQYKDVDSFHIILMVRAANNPPASFKMKYTQMLLSSNCTAILLVFPKRPMKADFSRGGATEQMRTK